MPHVTPLSLTHGPEPWLEPMLQHLMPGDYDVITFTSTPGYRFNEAKAGALNGRKIVILDYFEYGMDESWRNKHLLGYNSYEREHPEKAEYARLAEWVRKQKIIAYFKREFSSHLYFEIIQTLQPMFPVFPVDLLSISTPGHIVPLDYDGWCRRGGGVFHLYGHSHQDRKDLHGVLQSRFEYVANHLGNIDAHITHGLRVNLLEQVNHINRYHIDRIFEHQGKFMFSVALPGFGVKCFRNCEACINSIPVVADLGMKWAVPWTNENAIMLPTENGRVKMKEAGDILFNAVNEGPAAHWKRAEQANDAARRLVTKYYVDTYINANIRANL